jgi:hypothetical protein
MRILSKTPKKFIHDRSKTHKHSNRSQKQQAIQTIQFSKILISLAITHLIHKKVAKIKYEIFHVFFAVLNVILVWDWECPVMMVFS